MMYMLDTNICIYAIKNKPLQVLKQLQENYDKGICISAITLAELEHCAHKSSFPDKNRMALIRFLSILKILPFDDMAALEYGKICAFLQKNGTPVGTMDMLIAGHAKANNLILVTNNTREFMRIPELAIENWAE